MSPKQLNDHLRWLKEQEIEAEKSLEKLSNRIVRIQVLEAEVLDLEKHLKNTADRIDEWHLKSKVSGRIEGITDGERPLAPVHNRHIGASALEATAGFVLPLLAIFGVRVAPSQES
jgi:hypothetical protein